MREGLYAYLPRRFFSEMPNRNAIHESGHAVAACLLGLQISSVSAGKRGRFQLATEAKSNPAAIAITYLAGAAAERVLTGDDEVWPDAFDASDVDYDRAADAVVTHLRRRGCSWFAICGDDRHDLSTDVYEQWMLQTTSLIRNHWPCVKAVANELTKRRKLTGGQVLEVFRREEARSTLAQFVG